MNISTYSPALVILFVGILFWILLDIHFQSLTPTQQKILPVIVLSLAVCNHLLKYWLGSASYVKLIFLTMHLPYFLLILWIAECGVIKAAFMIFSAVVFTAPTIILGNWSKLLFGTSSSGLLFANLFSYAVVLLLVHFFFRHSFHYLIKHGDNRFLLRFSLIPFIYYVYLFASMNLDFSALNSLGGLVVRIIPTLYIFLFYLLMLKNYQELNEKRQLEVAQTMLTEQLDSAKKQISLLRECQLQTAIHRHDLRHHLTAIDGYLSLDKPQQASQYIKEIQQNIESFTPKQYCENELVNLLCSSFSEKAQRANIQLNIKANLPKQLSIPDMELCSILSNGLENAILASASLDQSLRWINFYCEIKSHYLLIEIKNPCSGKQIIRDGLPISEQEGHGYGCESIQTVAAHYHGSCSFEMEDQIFTMRVLLPLTN